MYAFWHFDDFSWGNTRMVLEIDGERKAVEVEDGEFDPSAIQKRRWQAYEDEICDQGSTKVIEKNNDPTVGMFHHLPTSFVPTNFNEVSNQKSSSIPSIQQDDSLGVTSHTRDAKDLVFPSDEAIVSALYPILETADLMKVTKKQGKKTDSFALPHYFVSLGAKILKMISSTSRAFKHVWK
jgi:chitin synthase